MTITKAILTRVESGKFAFSDPCIICGSQLRDCGHGMEDTAAVIKTVRKLNQAQKEAIRSGE